jgi:hypothetical protein
MKLMSTRLVYNRPEELENLYPSRKGLANELLGDLKAQLNEAENAQRNN